MTIENRPEIAMDWKSEYEKQRKDRLQHSVDEYLQDSDVSIQTFYNDLKDCIQEIITYHKNQKEKADGALQLVLGHRIVDELDIDDEIAKKWRLKIPSRY